jgi:hypothetical protein
VVQALVDAASAAALSVVGRHVGGPIAGAAAGAIAAFYGPFIYFTGQLEPATPLVFAVSFALLATPFESAAGARRWTVAGVRGPPAC